MTDPIKNNRLSNSPSSIKQAGSPDDPPAKRNTSNRLTTVQNTVNKRGFSPAQQVAAMQKALGPSITVVTQTPKGKVMEPTVWMSQSQRGMLALRLPGESERQTRTFRDLSALQRAFLQEALGPDVAVVEKNPGREVTKPTVWMSQSQRGMIALKVPGEQIRTFSNLSELQNVLPSTEISSMEPPFDFVFPAVPGAVPEKTTNNSEEALEKRVVALLEDDIHSLEENITMLDNKDKELTKNGKKLETELNKAREEKTDLQEKLLAAQKKLEASEKSLKDFKNEPKPLFPEIPGQSEIDLQKRLVRLAKEETRTLSGKVEQADKQIKTIEKNQTALAREQDKTGFKKRIAERELKFHKERLDARSQKDANFSPESFINSLRAGIPKQLTKVEDIFYHIKRNFGQGTFNVVWESYKNKVPLEKDARLSQHGIDSINNFTRKYDSVRSLFTFSTEPPGLNIDATAVALDLMKLPENILNKALSLGQQIVITNDNVTNSEDTEDLKGQKAGGNDATWDVIPGAGSLGHTTIAMIQKSSGEWMISDQHGASSLVLHEFSHSIDFCFGELAGLGKHSTRTPGDSVSSREDFRKAWKADLSKTLPGSADAYYWQDGTDAGARETFAEVMADVYSGKNEHNWPNVKNFLKSFMESIR